jgi:glyoxylase-like metal-dependent hydrolase (beta-lactamase superfamily II)
MLVLTNTGGVAMTNAFLVADELQKKAVLFDAPDHTVDPLLDEAAKRGWDLIGLWLTHGHFDHFADHATVTKRFPTAQVLLHPLDRSKVERPDLQTRLFGLPFVISPVKVHSEIADNQTLQLGSLEVVVIHTPGHSPGHVAYHFPKENLLIGGDLIIGGSVGRTDLPDSNPRDLETSIRRIMALPPETKLLGGHGPATTLEREHRRNQFVRAILET